VKHLSLFSGIGGIDLAAEWAGMRTVAFVEQNKFCQSVLKKHWPDVPIFDDVCTLKAEDINEPIDIISGGFPCQDISWAGSGEGIEGSRSGLWNEFFRLICEIRPKYALMENVSALLDRGLGKILGDLASIGYDAQWHCTLASQFSAPHRRERIFIIAYPNSVSGLQADKKTCPIRIKWDTRNNAGGRYWQEISSFDRPIPKSICIGVDDGIPNRVDRMKALGNAVVPQQVYPILAAIAQRESA
jgi:DNA (cytosine-5)-methyltransferase 1